MRKSLNYIDVNDRNERLSHYANINCFLYNENGLKKISKVSPKEIYSGLDISINYLQDEENFILCCILLDNKSNNRIKAQLGVSVFLRDPEHNYVFISPSRDVFFLTNKRGLYLTSGIVKNQFITKYGVMEKKEYQENFDGTIPYRPIGKGDVGAIYSFDIALDVGESVQAYTWVIASSDFSEANLLQKDKQLKYRLAFSNEK